MAVYKLWYEFRNNIPRQSRYMLGGKIDTLFLDIIESLYTASYLGKEQKLPVLEKARNKLNCLVFFLQIIWEIKILDNKKYIIISEHINEIGKMLGGWIKGIQNKTPVGKKTREI